MGKVHKRLFYISLSLTVKEIRNPEKYITLPNGRCCKQAFIYISSEGINEVLFECRVVVGAVAVCNL